MRISLAAAAVFLSTTLTLASGLPAETLSGLNALNDRFNQEAAEHDAAGPARSLRR